LKRALLAATFLSLSGAAHAQITPGSGAITDASGNEWLITASGSIQENGQWTPGGGGTAALLISGGVIYGEDATGRGWFVLSPDGQTWAPSPAPASASTTPPVSVAAQPAATTAPAACGGSPAAYGVLPLADGGVGRIFDAHGQPFLPRGIGVIQGQEASAAALQALFPGINFVRYAIYDYASPQTLSAYVNSLTSAGIVVELEDHNNGAGNAGGSQGSIFTGQALTNELGWYSAIAAFFKGNGAVWFGTNNEPSETDASGQADPSALAAWQLQTYQAIRGAGNDNPILLELDGWADPASFGQGYNPADYASMYNVVWDMHFYGWLTNSTNLGTNESFIEAAVKQAQQFTSSGGMRIPVIIGEYGNSTTGTSMDSNGTQVVQAVQAAAMDGTIVGTAAWAWAQGNPGDGLLTQGGGLSGYGQQVAAYVSQAGASLSAAVPAAACQATNVATTSPTQTATVTLSQPPASATAPAAPVAASIADPAIAPGNAAAQADIDQADAIIAHATAALQGNIGQGGAQ
jgi:hypothetical protein